MSEAVPKKACIAQDDAFFPNPFGMNSEVYDELFLHYTVEARALYCAEEAVAEIARRKFRRDLHIARSKAPERNS